MEQLVDKARMVKDGLNKDVVTLGMVRPEKEVMHLTVFNDSTCAQCGSSTYCVEN